MNKQEALSQFLNKSVDEIYLDVNDCYTDQNTGTRYEIYTHEEIIDKVRGIILERISDYDSSYIIDFLNIEDHSYEGYSYEENKRAIIKILDSSFDKKTKNSLIMGMMSDFGSFFNNELNSHNGFGGFLRSEGRNQYPLDQYLIYIFND